MENKIQPAHWYHFQTILLTAHPWITAELSENIVISDDLTYNNVTVYRFLKFVMGKLLANQSGIKLINIFIDGAWSQFKQKFKPSRLNRNKLVQVWKITSHFYLSPFRCVVNSALKKVFFKVCYKNHISWGIGFNVTHTNCTLSIF